MKVVKRDGSSAYLDTSKIHKMIAAACNNINNVKIETVEKFTHINFYDGITTDEIQNILIRNTADLINPKTPNYQYVAGRLLLFSLRKQVWKGLEPINLLEQIRQNVSRGFYQQDLEALYPEDEWNIINSYINYDRDLEFNYAGIKQICDKYLIKNRVTGEFYETPQVMYVLIAAILFSNYSKDTRLQYVKDYYDLISTHKINLATPILAGVRSTVKQYSSCVLIKVADSLKSIFAANSAMGMYVAKKAGIGLDVGNIRARGASIRSGEAEHTGAVGFIKVFESTLSSCSQGGVRKGSATLFYPIWHKDVESFLVLKNNRGLENDRARKLDYGVSISKLFYERFLQEEDISLFDPNDVRGLYECFGMSEFDKLYLKYEQDLSIPRKVISSVELFVSLFDERADTGRIYILNIDSFNQHSSFDTHLSQSNLCMEIGLPTKPFESLEDTNGEIATCILSAINLGKINHYTELESICNLAVRALDNIIDLQEYPFVMAELSAKQRRNIGIGWTNFAYYLAKNYYKWDTNEARQAIHQMTESLQYYCLKASNIIAKERGACTKFNETKYSKGVLPIDTYNRNIDEFASFELVHNWDKLRQDIVVYGLRNSTLTAQMPCESSSLASNSTNGIEPPREAYQVKTSKSGSINSLVPDFNKYEYQYLWEFTSNEPYLKMVAIITKFIDQSVSANTSYNPMLWDGKVPINEVVKDILLAYKWGIKALYYHQTNDMNVDNAMIDCKVCSV
jgi:ribonucleoside-diphosphate reductase alpha chain